MHYIPLFHRCHELINIHLKRQSTEILKGIKEVFAKEPSIPGVHSRAFLLLHSAEVELIAISTFEEERARNVLVTIW